MTSADAPSLVSLQCHVLSQYLCSRSECNTLCSIVHIYVNILTETVFFVYFLLLLYNTSGLKNDHVTVLNYVTKW